MLVICASCKNLIPEENAIKMTIAGYKSYEQIKLNIPLITIGPYDNSVYTQICQKCYRHLTKGRSIVNAPKGLRRSQDRD